MFLLIFPFCYFKLQFSSLQFDCGIHPAYSGMAALPYFDEIDPSTIDVLLVTQYVVFLFFPPSAALFLFGGWGPFGVGDEVSISGLIMLMENCASQLRS